MADDTRDSYSEEDEAAYQASTPSFSFGDALSHTGTWWDTEGTCHYVIDSQEVTRENYYRRVTQDPPLELRTEGVVTPGGGRDVEVSETNPAHYRFGKFEIIDVIEDWDLGFNLGNAVKYIARSGKKNKGTTKLDLTKAIWYLKRRRDEAGLTQMQLHWITEAIASVSDAIYNLDQLNLPGVDG